MLVEKFVTIFGFVQRNQKPPEVLSLNSHLEVEVGVFVGIMVHCAACYLLFVCLFAGA